MQQVGINAERCLAALVFGNLDLMLLGKFEQGFATLEVPFAPWSDHLDVRL